VVAEDSLDDLRSADVRFLQQASMLGRLRLRVPSDVTLARSTGRAPTFPEAERLYLARSFRWVAEADIVHAELGEDLAAIEVTGGSTIAVRARDDDPQVREAAQRLGIGWHVVPAVDASSFPEPIPYPESLPDGSRVIVTGSFDWLHSGHVRFFMEAASFGTLYVVVGSDRNVALLKGPGHPLQGEAERRYMVGSIRTVHACLISSGSGWLDAEPEIERVRPTYYVVNEDGDQPEKRRYCDEHGIEYVVLQRTPHTGLPPRSSTALRGF
jgi:cytidyltransferase-like protein